MGLPEHDAPSSVNLCSGCDTWLPCFALFLSQSPQFGVCLCFWPIWGLCLGVLGHGVSGGGGGLSVIGVDLKGQAPPSIAQRAVAHLAGLRCGEEHGGAATPTAL